MGDMNATYCTFNSNIATAFGGALLNTGTLNLNTNTFTNNTAISCYGGAIVNGGQLTITGSNSYTDNSAYIGGVIYNAGNLIINANSVYTDNHNYRRSFRQWDVLYGCSTPNWQCNYHRQYLHRQ